MPKRTTDSETRHRDVRELARDRWVKAAARCEPNIANAAPGLIGATFLQRRSL